MHLYLNLNSWKHIYDIICIYIYIFLQEETKEKWRDGINYSPFAYN
jgi:hypothetical protein